MEILNQILSSSDSWAATIARLTVGLIILPHGIQKVFGLYGGEGFSGTMKRFTKEMGFPSIIAFLIISIEFFGAVFLILGFASRIMALGVIVLMIGAILVSHRQYGYFLNWHNTKEGEGMQFNLLMIGTCIVVMILGSGKIGLDNFINL